MSQLPEQTRAMSLLRLLAAVAIGLAGSVLIWVAVPYNNFIIAASYIADSYLPVAGLALTLVLVLGVNPLLRWWFPRLALRKWQLAISVGMFFVACVLPGQGLLRMLPYDVAGVPLQVRADKGLYDAYREMNLPPSLFPEKLAYQGQTPVSDYFVTELPPGEPVPWGAWLGPMVTWLWFLGASWLMMAGLSLIVLPQWRRNERLSFPLLMVQEALIEEPREGLFPPLFRKRGFWVAALAVLGLHLLAGANVYWPQAVPAIPLKWDLARLFTEEPLNHLPFYIYQGRLYFSLIAVAVFVPTRISLSIWVFTLAYAGYRVIRLAWYPPYSEWGILADHRSGAIVAMTVVILWLGRKHWRSVLGTLLRRARDTEDRHNRRAAILFLGGCAGMWAFLAWTGVGRPGAALASGDSWDRLAAAAGRFLWPSFYVAYIVMVSILISRLVAETGLPFIRIDPGGGNCFVRLVPLKFLGPVSLYFSSIINVLFLYASRVSFAAMGSHAIGLDRDASSRHRFRLAVGLVALLVVGFVVCGASHLWYTYHHSASLDGKQRPIGEDAINEFRPAGDLVVSWRAGRPMTAAFNEPAHIAFGAGLASLLYGLCLALPKWPLHPVGLLMVNTFYQWEAWPSIFIGWLVKTLVVRYGGARLYRSAIPVFLGLILGEVFAAVFWGLEPAVRVILGLPYKVVQVLPF